MDLRRFQHLDPLLRPAAVRRKHAHHLPLLTELGQRSVPLYKELHITGILLNIPDGPRQLSQTDETQIRRLAQVLCNASGALHDTGVVRAVAEAEAVANLVRNSPRHAREPESGETAAGLTAGVPCLNHASHGLSCTHW